MTTLITSHDHPVFPVGTLLIRSKEIYYSFPYIYPHSPLHFFFSSKAFSVLVPQFLFCLALWWSRRWCFYLRSHFLLSPFYFSGALFPKTNKRKGGGREERFGEVPSSVQRSLQDHYAYVSAKSELLTGSFNPVSNS